MWNGRKPGPGRTLAKRRKAVGLTQQALGQLTGINEQTIALIETNRRTATDEQLAKIRVALKQRLKVVNREVRAAVCV